MKKTKARKETVVRTVRAVLPDPDCGKHWFRVELPSGEEVSVGVIATRGEGNRCVVLTVRGPKGCKVVRGEAIRRAHAKRQVEG